MKKLFSFMLLSIFALTFSSMSFASDPDLTSADLFELGSGEENIEFNLDDSSSSSQEEQKGKPLSRSYVFDDYNDYDSDSSESLLSSSDDSSSDDDTKEELPKRKAKAEKTVSTKSKWVPSKKPALKATATTTTKTAKLVKELGGNQLNALLRQARRRYKLEKNAGIAAATLAQVKAQATAGNATAKNILKYLSLPNAKK